MIRLMTTWSIEISTDFVHVKPAEPHGMFVVLTLNAFTSRLFDLTKMYSQPP
jgi:hypothetical protein